MAADPQPPCTICFEPVAPCDSLQCGNGACCNTAHWRCMLQWQMRRDDVVQCLACNKAFPAHAQLLLSLYSCQTATVDEVGFPAPRLVMHANADDACLLMALTCFFWMFQAACAADLPYGALKPFVVLCLAAMVNKVNLQRASHARFAVAHARLPFVCKMIWQVTMLAFSAQFGVHVAGMFSHIRRVTR